jgi:hypothetical protein
LADLPVSRPAVGIILDCLLKEGPSDKVQALVDKLPGADALVQAARAGDGAGGVFAGIGGIMGVGSRLMGAGLGMDQIRIVTQEVIAYARQKVDSPLSTRSSPAFRASQLSSSAEVHATGCVAATPNGSITSR